MKNKGFLALISILGLLLPSCNSGVHHNINEYILDYELASSFSEFKILQLTDTHIGDKEDQDLHFRFMDLTVNDANPDMIVVTGDLFTFASKSTAKRFFSWLDSKGKPWTVTFGNHDEQCLFSVDWLTNYLNNYGSHCLFKDLQDDDIQGNANFAINLKVGGSIFEQLIVMDTNRYYYGNYFGYDFIHQDQIDWYDSLINYTKDSLNGGTVVESLLFYHIPLPEIDDAYEAGNFIADETGSIGVKGEKTCPPDYNSGFFSHVVNNGSTKAMFFGHDHRNDFCAEYQGVWFSYGTNSTSCFYYDEDMMGGQVITIKNDHSLSIRRIHHTYKEVL